MDIINTEEWPRLEGLSTKGKRNKRWLIKGETPPRPYLFKEPKEWARPELWSEILVYHLGLILGVQVPETFLAINQNKIGVLVKYFLHINPTPIRGDGPDRYAIEETLMHGGDLLANEDPVDYKGKHNIFIIKKVFEKNGILKFWKEFIQMIVFDCLVGNTDRHQDNWGICVQRKTGEKRLAPAYDNSTCFAPEKSDNQIISESLLNLDVLEVFLNKSPYPIYWSDNGGDCKRLTHTEFIKKLVSTEADTIDIIRKLIVIPEGRINAIIESMIDSDVPHEYKLSNERADLIRKSLVKRAELLNKIVNH